MFDSVRARLTAWHTLVLAAVLVTYTAAAYLFLAGLTQQRTDRSLRETAITYARAVAAEARDHEPDEAVAEALREFHFRDRWVLIYAENGRLVGTSEPPPEVRGATPNALAHAAATSLAVLVREAAETPCDHVALGAEPVHACSAATRVKGVGYTIVALQPAAAEHEVLRNFLQATAVGIPLALLLAGLGGWWLARKSLAPAAAMGERAARIGAGTLHERLPVAHPRDELGRLALALNELLARLEDAFTRQRQFMADASHELRTPVAIVKSEADVALSRPEREEREYRESLGVVRGEAERLGHIVDDLFTLARADAGDYPLRPEPLFLEELLADCTRAVRGLAARAGVRVEFEPAAEAPFRGDGALLRRLVLNLLDNAIQHTPSGGQVMVELESGAAEIVVRVSDTGGGIPREAQAHVFERFFRADPARGRASGGGPGAGLGLAIARWIAEAHGGSLALERSGPGGTTFTLTLPGA